MLPWESQSIINSGNLVSRAIFPDELIVKSPVSVSDQIIQDD